MMTKGCIVALLVLLPLDLRCFLLLLPNYIHVSAITMQYLGKREVLQHEYSGSPKPQYSPHLTSGG